MKTFFNRNSKPYGENKDLFKYFLAKSDYDVNDDGMVDANKVKPSVATSYVKLTDNATLAAQLDKIDYLINNLQDQITLLSGGTISGLAFLDEANIFTALNVFTGNVEVTNITSAGVFTTNGTSEFNDDITVNATASISDGNNISIKDVNAILLRDSVLNLSDYLDNTYAKKSANNVFTGTNTFKSITLETATGTDLMTFDSVNGRYTFGVNNLPNAYAYFRNGCPVYIGGSSGASALRFGAPDGTSTTLYQEIDARIGEASTPANIENESISFNKDENFTDVQLTGKTVNESFGVGTEIVLGDKSGIYTITFCSGNNGGHTDPSQPVYLVLSVGATNVEAIIEHKVDVTTVYNASTGADYCIRWDGGFLKMKDNAGATAGINVLVQPTYLNF